MLAKSNSNRELARDVAAQKHLLHSTFSVEPWVEWPNIESHLDACSELYFDSVTQIELRTWFNGRVALIGDAAYCPSLLAGEGAAFAMAGAYTLAGELGRARGDHTKAFTAYEQSLRAFIERKQRSARAFATSFAPRTSFGLFARDLVLHATKIPIVADRLMQHFVTDQYELPDY